MTCYSDEALDHRFTVVCGLLASTFEWERLLIDWRLLLASYNLPYFHMKEFAQSKKVCKKWERAPGIRARFVHQATEIIRDVVEHGVLCYVNHQQFNIIDGHYKLRERFTSPYALAGRVCVGLADRWRERNHKSEKVEYVFEDGGPDKGGLVAAMRCPPNSGDPIFKPSRDVTDPKGKARKGVVQLQTADFLAYELRKARVERFDKSKRPLRLSFYKLLGIRGFSMTVVHTGSIGHILKTCNMDPALKSLFSFRRVRALRLGFFDFLDQRRNYFEQVADNAVIRHFKNRRVSVLINGDDGLCAFHADQVLDRAGDSHRQIHLWGHGLAGTADLALHGKPTTIANRTRGGQFPAQRLGQLFHNVDIVLFLDAPADGDDDFRGREIDSAGGLAEGSFRLLANLGSIQCGCKRLNSGRTGLQGVSGSDAQPGSPKG